jgi:ferritin
LIKLDTNMLKDFNQQIQEETYSSYIYLSMAADLEASGFKGMATWMQVQAREEKYPASEYRGRF